jgi:hypothetical protein
MEIGSKKSRREQFIETYAYFFAAITGMSKLQGGGSFTTDLIFPHLPPDGNR